MTFVKYVFDEGEGIGKRLRYAIGQKRRNLTRRTRTTTEPASGPEAAYWPPSDLPASLSSKPSSPHPPPILSSIPHHPLTPLGYRHNVPLCGYLYSVAGNRIYFPLICRRSWFFETPQSVTWYVLVPILMGGIDKRCRICYDVVRQQIRKEVNENEEQGFLHRGGAFLPLARATAMVLEPGDPEAVAGAGSFSLYHPLIKEARAGTEATLPIGPDLENLAPRVKGRGEKMKLAIGDNVTTNEPVKAYYSGYAGNPICYFEQGDLGTVGAVNMPYVSKRGTFVCVDFEKYGKTWRTGIPEKDLLKAKEVTK